MYLCNPYGEYHTAVNTHHISSTTFLINRRFFNAARSIMEYRVRPGCDLERMPVWATRSISFVSPVRASTRHSLVALVNISQHQPSFAGWQARRV